MQNKIENIYNTQQKKKAVELNSNSKQRANHAQKRRKNA